MKLKRKYKGGNHVLAQFLTLQTSNFTMTQNVLNRLHSISANHLEYTVFCMKKILMTKKIRTSLAQGSYH